MPYFAAAAEAARAFAKYFRSPGMLPSACFSASSRRRHSLLTPTSYGDGPSAPSHPETAQECPMDYSRPMVDGGELDRTLTFYGYRQGAAFVDTARRAQLDSEARKEAPIEG